MDSAYDVFISFRNTSPDVDLADLVYHKLKMEQGLRVFFSRSSLEERGTSAWRRAIDDALEMCQVMVVVGTQREHLSERWVRYEWDTFQTEMVSGRKPDGQIFVYIDELSIGDLPLALRIAAMVFSHNESGALDSLGRFVSNALRPAQSQAPSPEDSASESATAPIQRAPQVVPHKLKALWEKAAQGDASAQHALASAVLSRQGCPPRLPRGSEMVPESR